MQRGNLRPVETTKFNIQRHDLSIDRSLKAWSAADEYLLKEFAELENEPKNLGLYNDRFGYLACHLNALKPQVVVTNKSQEQAIQLNHENNKLESPATIDPLTASDDKLDGVLLKIPKSLGLFRLLLEHIHANSIGDVVVLCGFMTRHFTPTLLKIAEEYFEEVQQGLAVKKSRVLTLKGKKKNLSSELINTVEYNGETYKQYLGVFSADHIDYATQFFLENIQLSDSDQTILDLASGNGVIAKEISKKLPESEFHLLEDAYLAVKSAELNIQGDNIYHYYNNDLSEFEDETFDLIVTNPPFHFEYEINIQVPLELFKQSFRCLKKGGNLQIVSNQHLNYKTHLTKIFPSVEIIAEEKKFIVYKCTK